jgi:hypothetical protein
VPRLRPEAPPLRQKAARLVVALAAGAALAGFGGLFSRWCADPPLGWTLALAAAALGAAAGLRGEAPDEAGARAWAAGGAVAALALPALLRFLGLALADAAALADPLAGKAQAAFTLGQACLLLALAALAWTRALRADGARAEAAAAAAAAVAVFGFRRLEPSFIAAVAALAALAAAGLAEKPWSREAPRLRARVFAAAAAAGLLLSASAPGLLATVWMARLHAAYPGGGYLSYADDGRRVWAAYIFASRDEASLRDGVIQSVDPLSARLAAHALIGQNEGPSSLLILHAPQPDLAVFASVAGAEVALDGFTEAQGRAFDAMIGKRWRESLAKVPGSPDKPTGALLVLPRPFRTSECRRAAGPAALKALRARLGPAAALAVLIPPGAPAGLEDSVASAAAAAFGRARIADLPHATLVLASTAPVVEDSQVLFPRLAYAARDADRDGGRELVDGLRWRPLPSGN